MTVSQLIRSTASYVDGFCYLKLFTMTIRSSCDRMMNVQQMSQVSRSTWSVFRFVGLMNPRNCSSLTARMNLALCRSSVKERNNNRNGQQHACQHNRYYNKKLCYSTGTARRAMLVNSCHVSRGMGVGKASNSKSDLQFKVIGNGAIR